MRSSSGTTENDVEALQAELAATETELAFAEAELSRAKAELDGVRHQLRNVPLHISVGQYNVLAGYLGNNMEPWFLYGIDVCEERRRKIHRRFVEVDDSGRYVNRGWPNYVQGLLSEEEITIVERVHRQRFMWDERKTRVMKVIQELDVDLMSIVECDHYYDFFKPALRSIGYDSVWAQRPRPQSHDGCCIAWRSQAFECLASQVVEYQDRPRRKNKQTSLPALVKDRIALLTLMRSKLTRDVLIFASTHLARNPEEKALDSLRSRQISQVLRGISDFARENDARTAPVVLTGDLNATAFERLIGISTVATLLQEGPAAPHPFVFDCCDVPSRPTSVTTARQMRIDAILYQGKRMELVDACDVPQLTVDDPIPNATHPSDHVPVKATLRLRSWLEVTRQCAREWYLRLAGRGSYISLTPQELRDAFVLYDHDGSGCITPRRMSRAASELMGYGLVSPQALERFLAQCPAEGIDLARFVQAFKEATLESGIPTLQDIKDVFNFFDRDGSGSVDPDEFHSMLTDCSPMPMRPEEVDKLFDDLDTDGDGMVSMQEFVEYITLLWIARFKV